MARRHGSLIRSGQSMLPDEAILCATAWMHGVFGAQLTIGNTSFHKLFSVSRDPYNITRASGLRMLMETKDGWRLLTVPSAFEMGLSDCRWIYRLGQRTVTVSATVCGDEPAMQWRVTVEGPRCRFLVFGHLVLGEQEFGPAGRIEIDSQRKRFTFRPDLNDRWGQQYPEAVYRLVTSTPGRIEAIGGDELLYADGKRRSGGYAAIRTRPTNEFVFAVVGSMTDAKQADALASKYAKPVDEAAMLKPADRFWRNLTRGVRVKSAKNSADALAVDTILPWLAHDGMIHLTAPHGLEQYTGGAWGTRDVCQGSIELLLTLEHDQPVKEILRILFAQQYEESGDWPQWFMLEPYSVVQDKESHGDIIVWPLKALCDYIEATGDFAFLDEAIAWRRADNFEKTAARRPGDRPHRQADRDGARALHSGHEPRSLWQRRLERFAAAGRPDEARLDDERLDGRSALRAASPLRRNPSSGEARAEAGQGARRARGRDAQGLQHLSYSRRSRRRLWRVSPGGRRA